MLRFLFVGYMKIKKYNSVPGPGNLRSRASASKAGERRLGSRQRHTKGVNNGSGGHLDLLANSGFSSLLNITPLTSHGHHICLTIVNVCIHRTTV